MKAFYFFLANWTLCSGCVVAESVEDAYVIANEQIVKTCGISNLKITDLKEVKPSSILISKHHI